MGWLRRICRHFWPRRHKVGVITTAHLENATKENTAAYIRQRQAYQEISRSNARANHAITRALKGLG